MIFRWAPSSVGRLSGGTICVWDVLYLGWFSFGLNFRWNFRIVVRYFVLHHSCCCCHLIMGNSMHVALACVLFLLSVVVCFLLRLLRRLPHMCAVVQLGMTVFTTVTLYFSMGCMTSFVRMLLFMLLNYFNII